MKNVILFISLLFVMACSSNDESKPMVIDTYYTIMFKDVNGNNLLDPSFNGSFAHKEVILYGADEKGNKISNIYAKGGDIIKSVPTSNGSKSEYYISINAGSYVAPDRYIVYLSLPNGDEDKLEMKFNKSGQSQMKSEIYYNNKLVWKQGSVDSSFVIIK
ncbi:MAG: hypothetical protein ACRCVU_12485 [Flavobacterium sp.]